LSQKIDYQQILGSKGPFSALSDFALRSGQQRMASIVDQAIQQGEHCAIEAPSGLGKTWAYLIPALLSSSRVIISTAGHYLQEQLTQKDIPVVQNALGLKRSVVLLKGRHNYLCPYIIKQQIKSAGRSRQALAKQSKLNHVLQHYRDSGIGDIKAYELDNDLNMSLSCAAEECLGSQCPDFKICPLMNVRQKAEKADVVIINHSLLLSFKEGKDSLLNNADVVIVDEAHSLFDFALQVAGNRMGSRQLRTFIRRLSSLVKKVAAEDATIIYYLQQVEGWFTSIATELPQVIPYHQEQHRQLIGQFIQVFEHLERWFTIAKERDIELKYLSIQASEILVCLQAIRDAEGLCWIQKIGRGFMIQNTPVHLLDKLRSFLQARKDQAWILTSATLSIAPSVQEEACGLASELFLQRTGIDSSHFHRLPSPFKRAQQARLFLPTMQLAPDQVGFYKEFCKTLSDFIAVCPGRVLVLFSSYKALAEVSGQVDLQSEHALLIQGDKRVKSVNHYQLVKQFQALEHVVLLATGSFWEGVDLSGAALSAVVIDKLPFSSPLEPLVKLRTNYLDLHGVNSFNEYLLPEAIIRFRQGCGRLLRREGDKGVIMLADFRVNTKDYGSMFLNSMSDIPQCESLKDVSDFFAAPNH
jgi:ATP-dependent DNA helicase DinG